MKYINEGEVERYLEMKDVINILEEAFIEYGRGNAIADPRVRTTIDGKILNSMPAIFSKYKIAGLKVYFASRTGARFVVLVFNTETNDLEAIIEANKLGQVRTGALTAMVSRKIVKEKSPPVSIIGSGYQAETQLEGLLNVYNPESITVYSRNRKNAEAFSKKMSSKFGVDIHVASTAKEAVSGARIINTITNSSDPIFSLKDLRGEFHVNLAGANLPFRREVEKDVLEGSDIIIVEHFDQAMKESSEIRDYFTSHVKEKIIELKDFLVSAGEEKIRKSVFKSMGIGLEDIASAYLVLKKMGLNWS